MREWMDGWMDGKEDRILDCICQREQDFSVR